MNYFYLNMKATELLEEIRENLKDYPIEYLRNKVTDDRYKDPLTKSLAKYNSEAWDEIFTLDITDDYDIKDGVVENLKSDIDYYFETYAGGDEETREFTKYIKSQYVKKHRYFDGFDSRIYICIIYDRL